MIQLNILSGKTAGRPWVARRFPVRLGRAADCDLQLEGDGVWDQHVELRFDRAEGFRLNAQPDALVSVNGHSVRSARLRNGDTIQVGSVRIQFWLTGPQPRSLRTREWSVWVLITVISLIELALAFSLP